MSTVRSLSARRARQGKNGQVRARVGKVERPVTVKLDERRLDLLTGLALVDDASIADVVRTACHVYVESRLQDPQLAARAEFAAQRFRTSLSSLVPVDEETLTAEALQLTAPERDMASERPVSLRLAHEMVDYFTSLSALDDFTVADEMRSAVDHYIGERLSDPSLEKQIEKNKEDRDDLLQLLAHHAG